MAAQVSGYSTTAASTSHSHQQGRHAPPYTAGYAQTLPASSQYRQQPHSMACNQQVTPVNGQIDCTEDQQR